MSNNKKPVKPVPVNQIQINMMNNGSIQVNNFPEDYNAAMQVFRLAEDAIIRHFFKGIVENRFDANGSKKGSNIVVVKGNQLPV